MRWIAIFSFIGYVLSVALIAASLISMQWYEVKRFRAIPAANTTVVTTQTYGLFRLCQRAQGVTTCDRYDKLSKEDNIPREVHDGTERLFNAGVVCGFSLCLGLLEIILSVLASAVEFFRNKHESMSKCASRSGFTSCFFFLFGPLFFFFYGINTNNSVVVPERAFNGNVKYAFWLPIVSIVLLIAAGLLLELVGEKKDKNAVGSAI